jgi:hypothetical protein
MHTLYRIHIFCLHTRWGTQGLIPEDRPQQRIVYYALLTQAMEQLLVCAIVCICVHVHSFVCVWVCILCVFCVCVYFVYVDWESLLLSINRHFRTVLTDSPTNFL